MVVCIGRHAIDRIPVHEIDICRIFSAPSLLEKKAFQTIYIKSLSDKTSRPTFSLSFLFFHSFTVEESTTGKEVETTPPSMQNHFFRGAGRAAFTPSPWRQMLACVETADARHFFQYFLPLRKLPAIEERKTLHSRPSTSRGQGPCRAIHTTHSSSVIYDP